VTVRRARQAAVLCNSLLEPVSELGLWARKNRPAIAQARAKFDAAAAKG